MMAEQAKVSSVEAIDRFRSALVLYIAKAKALLESAADDATRTRNWVDMDRLPYWQQQARLRKLKLEDAQHELFSAEMANLREPTTAERAAVRQARQSLREAEEKLRTVIRWRRAFDNEVQPLLKQLEQFRTLLANDLPMAVQFLDQAVRTLESYAGIARHGALSDQAASASEEKDEGNTL